MDVTNTDIGGLVHRFRTHIKDYKSSKTKEAEIRLQFIDPFWRVLGWDVGDSLGAGPAEADVIIEKNVDTAEVGGFRSRRPDYLFRVGGFARFIVEAKKPSIDLDSDPAAIFQAKSYAWNSTIPFAILTDFDQFRLFDTTLKPIMGEPTRGLVADFKIDFGQYESQWDTLTATFGREAVEGGSLERLLAKLKKIRPGKRIRTVERTLWEFKGSEPVDREFLAYLDTHRRHFASGIYHQNKAAFPEADTLHGAAKLTAAVQRIMDRLVFMRVLEDRDVAPWGTLRETLDRIGVEGGEFYESLCDTFREYDLKYNGYLFKPDFSEQLRVDGSILADFTRTLYQPDGPWNFALIGDDILGIVYERFLGNVVTVRQGQASIEQKPEVRHAGGVYYTPKFVVDSIIRRVIGPKIQGLAPIDILGVKVLDPACGSGSFLVAALQYLFDYCLNAVAKNPTLAKASAPAAGKKGRKKKAEIAFQDKDGNWFLAPDFRAALLTNCIHGVDIDQQAAEVTVMSLYLKMLESKLPANWQTEWVETRLLPALDNNILCGNSLIDDDGYDRFREATGRNQPGLFDAEDADTSFRINRFDWTSRTRGFGRILDEDAVEGRGRAGFDCIIGNPPYIRVQELNKWAPEECEYYKWHYESAKKGNYDIYVVFTEKALSLLSADGLLGFIMPHKWWQAAYGEGLRGLVSDGKHLNGIVDFGHQQVFRGATTYTAIHILGRRGNKNGIRYAKVNLLIDGNAQCAQLDARDHAEGVSSFIAPMTIGRSAWRIATPKVMRVYEAVAKNASLTLADAAERLFQGVRTSRNDVFVLRAIDGHPGVYTSVALGRDVELEQGLLKPFLDGHSIRRFAVEQSSAVAIFPYGNPRADGGVDLLSPEMIAKKYPKGWRYLGECEKLLRAREGGAMDCDGWYAYGRTQNLNLFGRARILVPDMMERAAFAYDEPGTAAFVSGYGIIFKKAHSNLHYYFTGLLNSALLSEYLKSVSTPLRGGWYRTFPQFLRQVPTRSPRRRRRKSSRRASPIPSRRSWRPKPHCRTQCFPTRGGRSWSGRWKTMRSAST